jgi:hypothetical protein
MKTKWILITSKTGELDQKVWERYGDFESTSDYANAMLECNKWIKEHYADADEFYNELVDLEYFTKYGCAYI